MTKTAHNDHAQTVCTIGVAVCTVEPHTVQGSAPIRGARSGAVIGGYDLRKSDEWRHNMSGLVIECLCMFRVQQLLFFFDRLDALQYCIICFRRPARFNHVIRIILHTTPPPLPRPFPPRVETLLRQYVSRGCLWK